MEKAFSQARGGGKGTDAVVLRKDLWFQSVEQLIVLKARDSSPMFRIHSSALHLWVLRNDWSMSCGKI